MKSKVIFNKTITLILLVATSLMLVSTLSAAASSKKTSENISKQKQAQEVYRLSYVEREPGVDDYEVIMLVSDRYVRIDEADEKGGYILYDDKDKIIYSVAHHDQSILVINQYEYSVKDSPAKAKVEYLQLADAPEVSGNKIYNYRVYIEQINTDTNNTEELTCMELQLVEGLLPEVRSILKSYQKIVSGQQVKMTDNIMSEMQTACSFVDQIYNTGNYYDKGLPIQEWHSNESFKALTSYKKVTVSPEIFSTPENYKMFSIDANSKTFIN